jgi:hypothetical protein
LLLTKKTKFDDIVDVLLLFLYVTSKKLWKNSIVINIVI